MLSQYLVQWDGYQANLQAACEKQFLSESFVDVTLAVETGLIKCHRVVLSAASSYFQQLLTQHDACPHPIIFMRDMQYWEVIALVDFMYRGEVSVEEDKLAQLMKAAHTLQIHGLSACLKACLLRTSSQHQGDEEEDGEERVRGRGLARLTSEVELRPVSPSFSDKTLQLPLPTNQRNVVKEEIEFIEEKSQLSPPEIEPIIQIQSVFSERSSSHDKEDISDDCIEQDEPSQSLPESDHGFRQFLLLSPLQDIRPRPAEQAKQPLQDTPLYKKYSPRVLEQALNDLHTGRFKSIRACARHHGIPMTTLRYRSKVHPKRSHWLHNSTTMDTSSPYETVHGTMALP